jgi:hypothetical protein
MASSHTQSPMATRPGTVLLLDIPSPQTVEVSFEKMCETMMVTVCQPTPGYGYNHYGHNYCKEVSQETCYNVPIVTPVTPAVDVIYPEPIKTCVNKPIPLPRISCEDLSEQKCITVPEVEIVSETFEKCITALTAPACQAVELTLPKQVCKEINYGYAEAEPAYAPAFQCLLQSAHISGACQCPRQHGDTLALG